jgi:hypothetical protein
MCDFDAGGTAEGVALLVGVGVLLGLGVMLRLGVLVGRGVLLFGVEDRFAVS